MATTSTLIALIGSSDDFDNIDDLITAWKDGTLESSGLNGEAYELEVDVNTPEEVLVNAGRGLYFENDWSSDHTVSIVDWEDELRKEND
jgi:hypothetical protein|tara:strand:- start:940 stop:1206 length:267 start_codon:yes stop_codon:yes gene_type:complete